MSIDPNLVKELNDFLPSSTKEKLLNPSAGVIGQGIAGMLLWVFQKPLKFGIVKKYEFDKLSISLAEGISKIASKNLTNEKSGLFFKTLQESIYSMDSDDLRYMFSNLATNTLDKNNVDSISPRFVTILANLSPKDALFLKKFKKDNILNSSIPSGDLLFKSNTNFALVKKDLVISEDNNITISVSEILDNLKSLGILTVEKQTISTRLIPGLSALEHLAISEYEEEEKKPGLRITIGVPDNSKLTFEKSEIRLTELGKSFLELVLWYFIINYC